MSKNIGKSLSKNLSGECSQNPLDNAKQSVTNELKSTSITVVQKSVDAKNWVGLNDGECRTYNTNSQIIYTVKC